MVQGGVEAVELEGAAGLAQFAVQRVQPVQHPALQLRHVGRRNPLFVRETGHIAEDEAQRVAQPAIGVGLLFDDLRPDAQVFGIVRGDDPQAQDIGAVPVADFLGRRDVAQRLGHLAPFLVRDEAVGQHGVVRRPTAGAAGFEQGGMEPAAMLVRAFEIERGRPDQLARLLLQAEGVGAAALEPDVENVVDLFPRAVAVHLAEEALARAVHEPGVGTFFAEGFDNARVDRRIVQHFAGRRVGENGDRHAPGALARDHPIRPLLDHGVQAVPARRREEAGCVDGIERGLAQALRLAVAHADEPLRRVAEDDRLFRAPGMGVLVLQAAARDQGIGFGEGRDHRPVGAALLPLVGNDEFAGKAGRVFGERTVGADGEGNRDIESEGLERRFVAGPDLEIVPAVAGRGVDEAGAGIVGNVLAGQQGHVKPVTTQAGIVQWMSAERRPKVICRYRTQPLECFDPRDFHDVRSQRVGQDQPVAGLRPVAVGRPSHLVQSVGQAAGITDRPVAGDRPGRRRPDDDRSAGQSVRSGGNRELRPDRVRFVIEIFDFRLGERRALDDRPHDRLRAAIELAASGELHQLGGDQRLRIERHCQVGIVPAADHAEALELLALDLDPVLGEFAAFAPEIVDRNGASVPALGAVLLFDLPLDGQAVAVPARNVIRVLAQHLPGPVDEILEDLVEPGADMDVAVGVGRPVVQDELLPALTDPAQLAVQVLVFPALLDFRLLFRQAGTHGKVGLRQENRVSVVDGHR